MLLPPGSLILSVSCCCLSFYIWLLLTFSFCLLSPPPPCLRPSLLRLFLSVCFSSLSVYASLLYFYFRLYHPPDSLCVNFAPSVPAPPSPSVYNVFLLSSFSVAFSSLSVSLLLPLIFVSLLLPPVFVTLPCLPVCFASSFVSLTFPHSYYRFLSFSLPHLSLPLNIVSSLFLLSSSLSD